MSAKCLKNVRLAVISRWSRSNWKKACSKLEKAIDKAKSCEELEDAYEAFDDATELLTDKDYAKGQEMTDEEEDELDLSIKQLEKKYDRMEEKLCDDD